MTQQKFKRKQYLILKEFQLRYVTIILSLMIATAILCSFVVYYTGMLSMGEKLASIYPQGRYVQLMNMINLRIFLSLMLVMPIVAVVGIVLSHRIAGPIYRMEKYLRAVAEGNLMQDLRLREKDELKSLASGISFVVYELRETLRNQKRFAENAVKEVENLKGALETKGGDHSQAASSARKLSDELNLLSRELDKFKL